jgi:hypothetical protein
VFLLAALPAAERDFTGGAARSRLETLIGHGAVNAADVESIAEALRTSDPHHQPG